jgi:peptidoglycan lytic transglycosylase
VSRAPARGHGVRRLAPPALVLLLAGCFHGRPAAGTDARREPQGGARGEFQGGGRGELQGGGRGEHQGGGRDDVGLASYYADRFHGRPTASGQPYDRAAFTCAHPSAPFGARLRVTDLETGRSVVVTVNDRGPHVAGRVVDLSFAAAQRLGITGRGLVRVRVERDGAPPGR